MKQNLLIAILLLSASFAHGAGDSKLPKQIGGLSVVYLDYKEDEGFKFGKLKGNTESMVEEYVGTVLANVQDALKDPNSNLQEVLKDQKVNSVFVQIDLSSQEENPYECPPEILNDEAPNCVLSAYVHVYKGRVCVSTKDELVRLGANEFRNPTDCAKHSLTTKQKLAILKWLITP